MEPIKSTKKLKLISGLIYLFITVNIFSLNIFYPKFTLNLSYYINNTIFSIYNFFSNLPNVYKTYVHNIKYIKTLEEENYHLKENLNHLKVGLLQKTLLHQENEELKNLVALVKKVDFYNFNKIITTKVYNKNLSPTISIITLNVGTKHGIVNNMAVIANNALIGRISDCSENFSKVILLNNKTSRIPVYTKSTKINAIMAGNGFSNPSLISYEKKYLLKEGDTIYTSGLGGMFPRNIPIGTIYKENNNWIVTPFTNFHNIYYVHIITKPINNQV